MRGSIAKAVTLMAGENVLVRVVSVLIVMRSE